MQRRPLRKEELRQPTRVSTFCKWRDPAKDCSRTSVGVELSLVQVLDNLLDGRDRPVPVAFNKLLSAS